ncbi:274_t:CDS:2, partial [Rhizophagus irregularis]
SSTYCTYSIINPFIEEIKEDLLNPFLSSLSLSSIQFSPQSFSQSVLQETQETDEDIFIEENIEIETNLNQPVNTSGLLKMVRTKLYKNLCKYWNFQDSNALLASLLDPYSSKLASSNSFNSTSKNLKYKNSIFSRFQKAKTRIVNDELLEYLRLDKIDWKENPFAWWECQEKHFHYLSILARKYLPIPASSTASERIFSDASNIMGPKR